MFICLPFDYRGVICCLRMFVCLLFLRVGYCFILLGITELLSSCGLRGTFLFIFN